MKNQRFPVVLKCFYPGFANVDDEPPPVLKDDRIELH